VTDLDQPPAGDAGTELSAQIRARVAQRRGAADRSRHQISVAELRVAHLRSSVPAPAAGGPGSTDQATKPGRARGQAERRSELARAERAAADARAQRQARGGRHGAPPTARGPAAIALRLLALLLVTMAVVYGLRAFVVASYYIPSGSMEPTLHGCTGCEPDLVLVDKLSYRFSPIGRKDVVVFDRPPLAPPEDKQLIKRVIGLPGDTVSGHDGHVFVNGKQLVEPYVAPACHGTADFAAVTVPPGRYFMMGDNRCDSFDSRMFGTVARSAIVGRAFAVMWPVKHLRWL